MVKKVRDPRPSWDEYFMEIAQVVARRSNCSRRSVGAVIARNHHVLSAGYNGTPKGVKNCFEGGCPRCAGHAKSGTHLDECLCTHAEQNAICQAACYGPSIEGATIYVTISPCLTCAKLVIAYEPVWAIGTGKTATPDQAQEVHALIRATLAKLVGAETAETVRIQYGGSMKPGNAAELLAKKDIDGGLIGGAALKAADFAGIIAVAAHA